MQTPLPPENEHQRLAELLSYEILDSESEDVFDQLTTLASQICGTPIALISLIDQDRQWFKSRIGLDAQETHRNVAFCAHAILEDSLFEVNDALQDPRFFDNPLVTGYPKIRFYAGTPLVSPRGFALGTLCTLDDQPKVLDESQRKALTTLGAAVIAQLELRRNSRELRQAIQYKDHYLAYLSHEVRTPLNAISMFSRQLRQQTTKYDLPESFDKALDHIQTSGHRLLDIVDSVLNVEHDSAKSLKPLPRSVRPNDYLTSLFGLLQTVNEQLKLGWSVGSAVPDTITIDDTKVSQIISTLVNHFAGRLPANKQLVCQIDFAATQMQCVFTGKYPLVTEPEQDFLNARQLCFGDQFYISENFKDLSIGKHLIALLGGDIDVIDGQTVQLNLPIVKCASSAKPQSPETLHIKSDTRILIVEDNEINQIVISSLMGELAVAHAMVATGEEAVTAACNDTFDLIIMDIGLPGISGLQATEFIKQHKPTLPIVALTADAVTDRETMMLSGLDAILTKPIALNQLIRMLNHYLAEE
ncbi:GAF domain-containing hybrid sensor histidine kinase/response regulator [Alteromonas lipotrueiana]|uniref:GAF domain-containing hybrid sensor histidine kinase/response regulator n=1 Tax=Alteromonas lipotrueiana TaxID=2803815 RepID=UPI001C46BBC5|nr:GAF domain-containing hybrid sensor histidine kinase/response regulator [Alteromonas lipotrueiana]